MRRYPVPVACLIALTLMLCSSIQPGWAADDPPADYRIKPGDILSVSVWREEGLQLEVLVRPDGGISMPLAGDLPAAGRTVKELQSAIAERLEQFIPDPAVTVAIREIRGNVVYVIGKVLRPGEYIIGRDVDVMQALSMAGGMGTFASANDIRILRRRNGGQVAIPFNYGEVESGENLEQNIILQSGDMVVVP